MDDNGGPHWLPPPVKWQSLWLKSAQGLRRTKVGLGTPLPGVEFRNVTLIPQDLIYKTCNYRATVFNCNFGNDLQLHTNYRAITSDVLTATVHAHQSNKGALQPRSLGLNKGRALGNTLHVACNAMPR